MKKSDKEYLSNVWHFFPHQETWRRENSDIFKSAYTKKAIIHACDVISGNQCEEARIKCLLMVQTGVKYNSNYGVYRIWNVSVQLLCAISLNLKNGNSLINGTRCTIKNCSTLTGSSK